MMNNFKIFNIAMVSPKVKQTAVKILWGVNLHKMFAFLVMNTFRHFVKNTCNSLNACIYAFL
jgi:hypothetical protein